jgi:uncharacterized protein (TIGR00369 family)
VDATIMSLMRPDIRLAEGGRSELRFEARPEFTIPGGSVQGGIVAVWLDMAMAVAGEGSFSTADLQLQILRPVREGPFDALGSIVREGRRIVFAEAELRAPDGTVLARGRQTAVPVAQTPAP